MPSTSAIDIVRDLQACETLSRKLSNDMSISTLPPPQPASFLEIRIHDLSLQPGLTGVCAGYEMGEWRSRQLAEHLIEWLPEFVLRHSERESLGAENAVKRVIKA